MKTLLVASLIATLFAAPAALASGWPINQPIRGAEVRHSHSALPQSGLEWPHVC